MFALEQSLSGKIVPARVLTVLQNLQKIHGSNLVIHSIDNVEVNLSVRNLTNKQLMASTMQQAALVFGTGGPLMGAGCVLGPSDFQMLCEQTPSAAPAGGVYLRYLPNMPDRHQYLSGFWFY